jgi:transposase
VVGGEIFARAIMRGRFVRKTGGTVTIAEISAIAGVDITTVTLPDWVTRWAEDVALPPARGSAPSEWA